MTQIRTGDKVVDTVTGFKGIVTARVEYLHDIPQVLVQPTELSDVGQMIESKWITETRVISARPDTEDQEVR